jgi:hypothetical protein
LTVSENVAMSVVQGGAISFSFSQPVPFIQTTNQSDTISDEDYARHRVAVSFCPADTTQPTLVYVRFRLDVSVRPC